MGFLKNTYKKKRLTKFFMRKKQNNKAVVSEKPVMFQLKHNTKDDQPYLVIITDSMYAWKLICTN